MLPMATKAVQSSARGGVRWGVGDESERAGSGGLQND